MAAEETLYRNYNTLLYLRKTALVKRDSVADYVHI